MTNSKKMQSLLVRLPDWQHEYIEKLAEETGDSKSSIVRQIIFKHQRPENKNNE
jgi:predicted DNA-binding protein